MKKFLTIIPLVILFCFTFGCQDKEAMAELEVMKAQKKIEEQNKAKVKRFFEELDKDNYEFIREICAPEYASYYPSGVTEPISLETQIEQTKMTQKAISDRVHNIEELIAAGDKVIVRGNIKFTQTSELMGVPATGTKVEASSIYIFSIKDGKAVEMREELDMLGVMTQLGLELKPKEAEK